MVKTADQNFVRKFNTALVLELVRKEAPLSRASISAQTGLNRSTVSSIVQELLETGFLIETDLQGDKVGRPGILLRLNPNGGAFLGIEINVDYLAGVLVDFSTKLLEKRFIPSDPTQGSEAILTAVEHMITDLVAQAEQRDLPVMGIGVGLPGVVDTNRGSLVYAPNLGWRDTPVRDILQQVFDLPVLVDNEANCAVLGEYRFGISQNVLDVVYLSANVGLGGGILSDGKIFRGSSGFASEIGHAVIDPAGPACGCGRFGCWETFVGTRAVVDLVKKRLPGSGSTLVGKLSVDFADVLSAAQSGDALALDVLGEVGRFLGIGITNLVNIFNPRQVVLGGTLGKAAELLLPQISSVVFGESLLSTHADLRLDASVLKEEACLLGAVSLVYDEVIRDPIGWIVKRKNSNHIRNED